MLGGLNLLIVVPHSLPYADPNPAFDPSAHGLSLSGRSETVKTNLARHIRSVLFSALMTDPMRSSILGLETRCQEGSYDRGEP